MNLMILDWIIMNDDVVSGKVLSVKKYVNGDIDITFLQDNYKKEYFHPQRNQKIMFQKN